VPANETFLQRTIRQALNLRGVLLLAQEVERQSFQSFAEAEAEVEREEGEMEEQIVGEQSLEDSSSEGEADPDSAPYPEGNEADFFD
jgi:hypothetical protein